MKQEMTIEELKFAREIGATNCWNEDRDWETMRE